MGSDGINFAVSIVSNLNRIVILRIFDVLEDYL